MTITIPREVVRQACVAFKSQHGARWIECPIEVMVNGEVQHVEVRLEIQAEAALSTEAEIAREMHTKLSAIENDCHALRSYMQHTDLLPAESLKETP